MIYRGKVRGGAVVLQPGIQLPEELDVTVEPVPAESLPSSPVSCSAGTAQWRSNLCADRRRALREDLIWSTNFVTRRRDLLAGH